MMNKAFFLDRDGIINVERGTYTSQIEDFAFVKDIIPSLRLMKENGYIICIISNQGGIAKQKFTYNDVDVLHNHIIQKLREQQIELTEIYYCPHHSDIEKCICRKPDSLMLEKAIARFHIDTSTSFFIGDKETDIKAAEKVGVKGYLVLENESILTLTERLIRTNG